MKTQIARIRGSSALFGALALGAAVAVPSIAGAEDWLNSIQDQRCAPEDIQGVSANVRNAIEANVRRAEMAIQAPTPVGDLSCLNDLMTIPLDVFSGIGGLLGDLQNGLAGLSASDLNIDIDVSGMICKFAAVKFAELTEPLSMLDKTISGYASLASSATSRLGGEANSAFVELASGIWSKDESGGGGSSRISSGYAMPGVSSTRDSSGYSGSISSYVPPNTAASSSDVTPQTYETSDYAGGDESDEWALYNEQLMAALGQYIGCRVARSFDGTILRTPAGSGVMETPEVTCLFSPGARPASVDAGFESITQSVADRAANAIIEEIDRSGGQERSVAPEATTPAKPGSANTIWELMNK